MADVAITWENSSYVYANKCMETSWKEHAKGNRMQSWGRTVPARFAYLTDVIINAVVGPFAITASIFMGMIAFATCNCKNKTILATRAYAAERTKHFFVSFVGVISPGLAHKYENANIFYYVLIVPAIAMAALGICPRHILFL